MISAINLIFARPDAYTALIGGNGGEDELVISCSPGQNGMTVLSAVAMSVDGGALRMEPAGHRTGHRKGFPLVRTEFLMDAIRATLLDWAYSGISPSLKERGEILREVQAIVETIQATWGVHAI